MSDTSNEAVLILPPDRRMPGTCPPGRASAGVVNHDTTMLMPPPPRRGRLLSAARPAVHRLAARGAAIWAEVPSGVGRGRIVGGRRTRRRRSRLRGQGRSDGGTGRTGSVSGFVACGVERIGHAAIRNTVHPARRAVTGACAFGVAGVLGTSREGGGWGRASRLRGGRGSRVPFRLLPVPGGRGSTVVSGRRARYAPARWRLSVRLMWGDEQLAPPV